MFDLPSFLQKDGKEVVFIKVHSVLMFCIQFVLGVFTIGLHYVFGFVDCESPSRDKSHVNMRCLQTSLYLEEKHQNGTTIEHNFL